MDESLVPEFTDADLSGARFQNVNLTGARFREAMLVDVRMSGLIDGLVVNDVEVAPLISAELDRRYPERLALRPVDAAAAREAWTVVEGLWNRTRERAAELPEERLHEQVDGEWSFLETCRHLVFVTDIWISARVLERTGHHHPLSVAPTFIRDVSPFGIDTDADPAFADVVVMREERMALVRTLVAELTDDDLARQCGDQSLLCCLCVVLDEEWHHDWYANRDLDTLASSTPGT